MKNAEIKNVQDIIPDLPFRRLAHEIHAWTVYPSESDENLREEAMQRLNSDYFDHRRPDLIRMIEEKNVSSNILSEGRYLLNLSDERYEADKRHYAHLTVKSFWGKFLDSSLRDHMRIFIMLMEYLYNDEANQKKFNESFLGNLKSKQTSPVLKKLGSLKDYKGSFDIYKNVSPLILTNQSFLYLEIVDPEKHHNIFTSTNPSISILKRIAYFKKSLLSLKQKNTKPAEFFQQGDLITISREIPIYLSQDDLSELEEERNLIWSFLRPYLLQNTITSEKIIARLAQLEDFYSKKRD